MNRLKVLSYNIHKGGSPLLLKHTLGQIKERLHDLDVDLVLLQEVVGQSQKFPTQSQFEFLADQTWQHAYGKNKVNAAGHHGNAILSKNEILSWDNQDVSLNRFERRGILHAEIQLKDSNNPLHAMCVHLNLLEKDRKKQANLLLNRIQMKVPASAPLIVAGDFNDWRQNISPMLAKEQKLDEVFLYKHGAHAKTFPAGAPLFRLDRIYFRNMTCLSSEVIKGKSWNRLSDHLPIRAEIEF